MSVQPTDELADDVLTGAQVRDLIIATGARIGMGFDEVVAAAAAGILPTGEVGDDLADMVRCLNLPVVARD